MKGKLITADGMKFEVEVPYPPGAVPTEIHQQMKRPPPGPSFAADPFEHRRTRRYLLASYDYEVPVYEERIEEFYGTDKIREAFFLGFMVSREGFCSEFMDDGHAPPTLQPENGTVDQARAECVAREEFIRLRELAVDRLSK